MGDFSRRCLGSYRNGKRFQKLEEQIKKLDATIKEESGKIAAGDMKEGDRTIRKDNGIYESHKFFKGKPFVEANHPMFSIYTTNCDPSDSNVELKQPYDYTKPNYTNMTNGRRHRLIAILRFYFGMLRVQPVQVWT